MTRPSAGKRIVVIAAMSALVGVAATALAIAFTDTSDNVHAQDITAIAAAGITRGCNPPQNDRYCPDRPITRGEMATFLNRALELPAATDTRFVDTDTHVHAGDIAAVAAAGITRGCNPPQNDRYCPDRPITRGEMAAFLNRTFGLPPAATMAFADTAGSVFADDIDRIAAAGITRGCNPPRNDRYCPEGLVRRDQMASFLARALDLPPTEVTDCERWLAAGGSDGGDGSRQRPWATLARALDRLPRSGCVLTVLPGTYGGARIDRRFDRMTTVRSAVPYAAVFEGDGSVLFFNGASNLTFEGFEIRHDGPDGQGVVVTVEDGDGMDSTWITLRNNIIHDSFDNDLLKVRSGARFVTIRGNVFYNQGPNEQHLDINGVQDITIDQNIFFNDFAASGRADPGDTKAFIVVKDSSATGPLGSRRVAIRGNVFLNWQGGRETFLQIGNDGKDYHEAIGVAIENNLMVGNSPHYTTAILGVAGARSVHFVNNTVVGDLPSGAFAARFDRKGDNPANEGIVLANNIYADPTGTMGDFTNGVDDGLTLDSNLYWNAGKSFDTGGPVNPADDPRRVVADPRLATDHGSVVLPLWGGTSFPSGSRTIRQEFTRLVEAYGVPGPSSPAIDRADPSRAPTVDILGRPRGAAPDLGAYEAG